MQEQIFKDLEIIGHRFSKIEEELEMPKNYLSRFKNPKNKLPDKWVDPLNNYISRHNISTKKETTYPLTPKDMTKERTKLVVSQKGIEEKPIKIVANETMDKINKDFGAGTVMRFGDKPDTDYKVISTGSISLDKALGIGGLPRGRMVEIFGKESSGKSTISLNVIANAQKQGLKCLLVDAENSFDPEYAEALGVKVEELDYCQPTYGEEGFEVADRYITSGQANVVIIDSVAAMIPKAELEGSVGDSKMGLHARLMSQVCRKMVGSVAKTNTLIIFINQIRHKIGVMWESPEITTGGMALQFYASVRLSVTRSLSAENAVMNGNVKEGNKTTVKVIKNKCAAPFRSASFNIIYGKGIDRTDEVITLAIEKGIIKKAGSWFSYNEQKIGQGKDSVAQLLNDNPEMLQEIEGQL